MHVLPFRLSFSGRLQVRPVRIQAKLVFARKLTTGQYSVFQWGFSVEFRAIWGDLGCCGGYFWRLGVFVFSGCFHES